MQFELHNTVIFLTLANLANGISHLQASTMSNSRKQVNYLDKAANCVTGILPVFHRQKRMRLRFNNQSLSLLYKKEYVSNYRNHLQSRRLCCKAHNLNLEMKIQPL